MSSEKAGQSIFIPPEVSIEIRDALKQKQVREQEKDENLDSLAVSGSDEVETENMVVEGGKEKSKIGNA